MKKEVLRKKGYFRESKESFILVLYNDDINTFDHVIKSLIEVCGHDECQAEQCTTLAHLKGSCDIKTGSKEVLHTMCNSLNSRGLKSKVEML
jgi:ATP-dependent Clp protease adaptor protein ClpS